jgi:hypothetical protein
VHPYLDANNLINSKRNIFKSASNTFFLASLVYLKQQEILPHNKIVKITIIFSEVNLFLQKSHGDKLYSILYFMQLNLYKYIN